MTFFWLLFIVLLVYVAGRIYLSVATRILSIRRRSDEIHHVTTSDGWTLALHRYRPDKLLWAQPVFMCHGMGANRFNFDIAEDRSLAKTLTAVGFDVWILELRGHGQSDRPAWLTPFGWNYNFDDFLMTDIPLALKKVQQVTGHDKVFLLGHSMGGMLGLAHAGIAKDHGLAGVVAIGSPVSLRSPSGKAPLNFLARLAALGSVVRISPISKFFAPLSGMAPKSFSKTFILPGSTEQRLIKRIMFNLLGNEPTSLVRQFGLWQQEGSFRSLDGQHDYLKSLEQVDIPILVLAAEKDRLARPKSVMPAYELAGVKDKQFRVFGKDAGDEFDFGHGDLLLGRLAPKVVYTEIIHWLESRATAVNQKASSGKNLVREQTTDIEQ